ncbi:MAG TPA: MarR family transcriptional regulator [Longimicrobium sp.]|nr:MarR family transcriptional regulator [Longimicrobium sp.]
MMMATMEPGGGMHPADEEFVERVGRFFEGDGAPRTSGRMLGLLLLQSREMSIDEIADRLKVSRASVSTNARNLESYHVVERVSHMGDRRDFYRIAPDLERTLLRLRMERLAKVEELLAAGTATPAARDERVRGRLDVLARMHGCAANALKACCEKEGR